MQEEYLISQRNEYGYLKDCCRTGTFGTNAERFVVSP